MGIILNKESLATTPLRRDALDILEAGLEAIDTKKLLNRKVALRDGVLEIDGHFLDLKSYGRVIFVGIGKCALDGARALSGILGGRISYGAVIDVKPSPEVESLAGGNIRYFQGTHPYPSEQNVSATREILKMIDGLNDNDLVLCIISGGGSALFELPIEGKSLEDIVAKTRELTTQGADIYELNKARKELSQVKGGKFAQACFPAKVVSLLFSDVLGNDISVIASGPTVVEGDVKNILVSSNADALEAMEAKAESLGYSATIETDRFSGDAIAKGTELCKREIAPRSCILMGGETTVKIPENPGEGGRNQSMALAALPYIKPDHVMICAASDGFDNTDHAGALADAEVMAKASELGLEPQKFLEKSDSYNFWKSAGGAISTGRLGSNVSDLVIIISK